MLPPRIRLSVFDVRYRATSPSSPGIVRPQNATPTELDSEALASALGQPHRTVQRWLVRWFELGVPGIRRVPSRGSNGHRYLAESWLPEAWLQGELPAPHRAPQSRQEAA